MLVVVYRVVGLLCALVTPVPLGTNRGLVLVLWMLLTGRLLSSRGAVIPALSACGFPPPLVRRAWAAVGQGAWTSEQLLTAWAELVAAEGWWQQATYGGYRPLAADVTPFWRPRLQACGTSHYDAAAGRARPAIPIGIVARVGRVGDQRVSVPVALVRAAGDAPGWTAHHQHLLREAEAHRAADECVVVDSGVPLGQVQAAGVQGYVVRLPKHFTARRASPPPYCGRGRPPTRGVLVRPLGRERRGRWLPATPPDAQEQWQEGKDTLSAAVWRELVLPDAPLGSPTFQVVAVSDPRYRTPWLLACALPLAAQAVHGLYRDRWPVEYLPQTGKQLLGAARQFVSAPQTCQRWPELVLIGGAVLQYAAATSPAVPTGFWDRRPQRTPGRLRRVLAGCPFPAEFPWPARFRPKAAVTEHLPKGYRGQRRRTRASSPREQAA